MGNSKKDNRLKNIIFIRDGVYEIQISNGYREDGTRDRITETVYGDENVAIARRDEIKAELAEKKSMGIKVSNSGFTFLYVSTQYLKDRKYRKRVGTTTKGYKILLNNHILPEFGMKKIRNITPEDLENLYEKMAKKINPRTGKPLSGTTIKHAHALITAIFNYAIHKQWASYNPALFVDDAPKFDTKEREYYDHDEIQLALSNLSKLPEHKNGVSDKILHSQNLRFKTAITILFNGGMRKEELFGLKWKDIKWNTNIFEIHRAVISIDSEEFDEEDIIEIISPQLICKNLKNDASRRNITMPTVCFDYLAEYRKDQIENGLSASDEDYIFQNVRKNSDGIWNPNYLTKEWAFFIKTNNMKKITVHDIRHSHATALLSMGVPIQDVSRRIGHSDIATTLKIYTHSNMGQDKLIAQKLEEKYGNQYVSSKLNFSIIASIIVGEYYTDENDVINAVSFITGKTVNEENKDILFSICKKYFLENYYYLQNILLFINKDVKEETKKAFIDLMTNISNGLSNIRPIQAY